MELKKKHSQLLEQKTSEIINNGNMIKKFRIEEYRKRSQQLDEKERELCRKTTKLVDELVDTCDETPFHRALIKILGNLKGK